MFFSVQPYKNNDWQKAATDATLCADTRRNTSVRAGMH
jgi:hypothetical protein